MNKQQKQPEISRIHQTTTMITGILYLTASISLILASFSLVGKAFYELYDALLIRQQVTKDIVEVITFTVIGIAVCDVGRYLVEEEVEHEKRLHSPAEARRTVTRFMVVVAIALSLEGLVGVFEITNKDITKVMFPLTIVICAVTVLIGLAVFQRLSAGTELRLQKKNGGQSENESL